MYSNVSFSICSWQWVDIYTTKIQQIVGLAQKCLPQAQTMLEKEYKISLCWGLLCFTKNCVRIFVHKNHLTKEAVQGPKYKIKNYAVQQMA